MFVHVKNVIGHAVPASSFLAGNLARRAVTLLVLGTLVALSAACSGGEATPTRIAKAATDAPTQTPWIIYLPITTTPEPFTATPLPTTTPEKPEPTITRTRAPATTRPTAAPVTKAPAEPTQPAEPPTAEAPPATPPPSCGQPYSVTTLKEPEDGVLTTTKQGSGQGRTLRFIWVPVSNSDIDPTIGYRVNIHSPVNSAALYISHNAYLRDGVVILNQQATYGLTAGDDITVTWSVDVIKSSGEFTDSGDHMTPPLGTMSPCGPTSPQWTILLHVE